MGPPESEQGYARLAIAAPITDVAAWARQAVGACRLRAASNGWVAAELADDAWDEGDGLPPDGDGAPARVVEEISRALGCVGLCIIVSGDGRVLTIAGWRSGDQLTSLTGPAADQEGTTDAAPSDAAPSDAAVGLAGMCGRPANAAALHALAIRPDLNAVDRHRAISDLLGLPSELVGEPPIGVPGRRAEIALAAVHPDEVRLVAGMAGLAGWVVPLAGYAALVPASPGTGTELLPPAFGVTAMRRRPLLYLWRDGTAYGYMVLRRERIDQAHVWGDAWQAITPGEDDDDPWGPAVGDARALARAFGGRDQEVALRALLRRGGAPDEALTELIDLLGLPTEAAELLTGRVAPADLGGAQPIQPVSPRAALWEARRSQPYDPWLVRALLWLQFRVPALVFGFLALSGIIVMADEGANVADALTVAGFSLAAAAFAVVARRRSGRTRRTRRSGRPDRDRGAEDRDSAAR